MGPQNPQPPQYPPQGPQPMPGAPYPPQPGMQYPPGMHYPPGMPHPGMGQVPYYPQPQKKGFPVWAIVLIVFLVLLPVCGIFGLAAIPLITTNTRDARRAEGEQMLQSLKGQARVGYARLGLAPRTLSGSYTAQGCNVPPMELQGKYFNVRDAIEAPSKTTARLTADPAGAASDGAGHLEFQWAGGDGKVTWDR